MVHEFPTIQIECVKSGRRDRYGFLGPTGEPWTTERAVIEHYLSRGYSVLRGEVKFWFAMFGVCFWDEIFLGHRFPTLGQIRVPGASLSSPYWYNDIPRDLFVGPAFYEARRERIEKKARQLATASLADHVRSEIERIGDCWSRIVFEGRFHGDFGYRQVLTSDEVAAFLNTVRPSWFASIVNRIAQNPNDHRSGLPDYMAWQGDDLRFVEAKKLRERLRESQHDWLSWMTSRGIPVEIARVKGV